MGATVKVKISNKSGISPVRFIGVQFDGAAFIADVNDGDTHPITSVQNGSVALTAFKSSDEKALDTFSYPVSDSMGFAALLVKNPDDPHRPYRLVGEPFVIPGPPGGC